MSEPKKPVYRVVTKRDAQMVKSFVLFTYRQRHPNVSRNFIITGLVSLALIYGIRVPAIGVFLLVQGLFCLFMGFFRHIIPVASMKKKDPDYAAGNTLAYDFYGSEIRAFRNGEKFLSIKGYDKITNLCHDEKYYYLGANEQDLMILPKSDFTVGDADSFEAFIEKKAKIKSVWTPATRSEKRKKNKAEAGIKAEKRRVLQEAQMAEMQERRAAMREAFRKNKENRKASKEAAAETVKEQESQHEI